MDTNRYFSFSRLGLMMKRDWMENWKTNLYRFMGPYAFILFVMLMCYMNMDMKSSFSEFSDIVSGTFVSVLFFGGIFSASSIMETMNTQQKRISFMMLPATSLEKFIVRALYVTIGFVLLSVLSLLLAEATRLVFLPLFDLSEEFQQSALPHVFSRLDIFADSSGVTLSNTWPEEQFYSILLGQICSLLYVAWMHSFFILGGCYWNKQPFWKTLGSMILVHVLVYTVFINALIILMKNGWEKYHEHLESILGGITINQSLTFFSVVLLVLILLNWCLAYRCFTRQQVIKPKFRLL